MSELICFIDDEPMYLEYHKDMLEAHRYRVQLITEVDEALAQLPELAPDLIVLDIMMPPGDKFSSDPRAQDGMRTGLLLYEEIVLRLLPKTKIIILTNLANPEVADEFRQGIGVITLRHKLDTTPTDLLELVRSELAKPL